MLCRDTARAQWGKKCVSCSGPANVGVVVPTLILVGFFVLLFGAVSMVSSGDFKIIRQGARALACVR